MAEAARSRWWELFAVTVLNCTTADVEWGTVRDVTDIHIDGLVKTFGSTRAVDGISLTVNSGEMFFLVGPSGCGKTTLLRMLAGFSTPDSGQIRFGTEDVTSLAPNPVSYTHLRAHET